MTFPTWTLIAKLATDPSAAATLCCSTCEIHSYMRRPSIMKLAIDPLETMKLYNSTYGTHPYMRRPSTVMLAIDPSAAIWLCKCT